MSYVLLPGYGRSGGSKTTAEELQTIFQAMEHNEILRPTRLLTGQTDAPILDLANNYAGYIPGAEALSAVEKLASKLKHAKPSLIYLLDRTIFLWHSIYSCEPFFPSAHSRHGGYGTYLCCTGCRSCLQGNVAVSNNYHSKLV